MQSSVPSLQQDICLNDKNYTITLSIMRKPPQKNKFLLLSPTLHVLVKTFSSKREYRLMNRNNQKILIDVLDAGGTCSTHVTMATATASLRHRSLPPPSLCLIITQRNESVHSMIISSPADFLMDEFLICQVTLIRESQ